MCKVMLTAQALVLGFAGVAGAQTMATTTTDLNVRSGPGAQYPVVGAIMAGNEVSVLGCLESANWCEVSGMDLSGWSYGEYLLASPADSADVVAVYPNREVLGVSVVQAPADPDRVTEGAAVGGLGGAAMGALIAGPVGAAVGAAIGSTSGSVAASYQPTEEVTTYVTTNSVEPVYLDGEVVIGAGVPEAVTVYDVPMAPDYRYAVINGQTVLVDSNTRAITYIYR